MKSSALTGPKQFEIIEGKRPNIQDSHEVLLKIGYVGICGSDMHYYREGEIGGEVPEYPFIIGHECSGMVEEVGEDVTRVGLGDVVAIDPAVACGECDQCRIGRPHTCRQIRFMGYPGQLAGGLSEYVVLPETICYPVEGQLTMQQSALVEPLSIGVYAVSLLRQPDVKTIGILGTGPIGLGVLSAAKTAGISGIYATDKVPERLRVAEELGAVWTGNPDQDDIVGDICAALPEQLDAVFECCGEQDALDQAVEIVRPGGQILIVGIPAPERISFAISRIRRKEINIQNVRRQNNAMQEALDLLAAEPDLAQKLMTHVFPLGETGKAFDLVDRYADGVVKALIEVNSPDM